MLSIPRDPVRLQVSEQGGVDPLGAAVSTRTDKHPSGAKNPEPRWRCHVLGCSCSPSTQQGLPGRRGWGVPAARNTHQLYFFFVCFLPQIFFPGFCFYYYFFFLLPSLHTAGRSPTSCCTRGTPPALPGCKLSTRFFFSFSFLFGRKIGFLTATKKKKKYLPKKNPTAYFLQQMVFSESSPRSMRLHAGGAWGFLTNGC